MKFVEQMKNFTFPIDICSGKFQVDAKSVLGVLGICEREMLVVKAQCDYCGNLDDILRRF